MSAPLTPLADGANASDLNTTASDLETYLNAIPASAIRRGAFNREHSRSVVSNGTTNEGKVYTPTNNPNFVGGTYAYDGATWTALGWTSHTADGGSDTNANRNSGTWSIVGHAASSPGSAGLAEIAISEDLGMANSADGDGCAGILLQGNIELESIDVGSTTQLHVHMCFQFESGGLWYTIHSSNRIWDIETLYGLADQDVVNIDMNCVELLTKEIVNDAKAGATDVSGVRMMISMSDGGSGAPTGASITLGNWAFSAIGLYSSDPV